MRGLARLLTWAFLLIAVGAAGALGAAGGRDASFGANGFTTISVAGNNEFLEEVVVLENGKILAAGGSGGPPAPAGFTLVRLLRNGAPDPAFGTGGVQIQPDTGPLSPRSLAAIEMQTDGKIVGAGLGRGPGGNDAFGFARYLADGTPDTTFGDNGIRIVQPTMSGDARDVAPTPNGGVIAVGGQGSGQVAIVKLTSGGDPDTAFGPGGIRSLDVPGGSGETGNAVRVLADGTILIGGSADTGAFLAKLEPDGDPIAGFGTAGIATFNFGDNPLNPTGEIFAVAPLPGGGVAAAGDNFISGNDRDAVVLKAVSNGSPDQAFGTNGQVHLNPTAGSDSAFDLVRVEDRLLAAGQRDVSDADSTRGVWLFRLLRGGALDATFGAGGQRVHKASPKDSGAFGLALQPDGRPVIAGTVIPEGENFTQLLVGRFQADPTCFGRLPTVRGTGRRDVLRGTRGRDVIVGLAGPDVIRSFTGRDLICSGAGPDRVLSGRGRDRIDAGGGRRDFCNGGQGRDQLLRCERRR